MHVAGIVPVAGLNLNWDLPWHESLMPVGDNVLAIERAVLECAYAGCDTIWLVLPRTIQPFIRKRLGNYAQDPLFLKDNVEWLKQRQRKLIPIFYVATHPKDIDTRESLPWSIISGAELADGISRKISTFIAPTKYYVAFPYGVIDPSVLADHRDSIRSKINFTLHHDLDTVATGEFLGFTFGPSDLKIFLKNFRSQATLKYKNGKKLSIKERYSGRFLKLEDIFNTYDQGNVHHVAIYHNISTWEGYRMYMGSLNSFDESDIKFLGIEDPSKIGEQDLTES